MYFVNCLYYITLIESFSFFFEENDKMYELLILNSNDIYKKNRNRT